MYHNVSTADCSCTDSVRQGANQKLLKARNFPDECISGCLSTLYAVQTQTQKFSISYGFQKCTGFCAGTQNLLL